MDENKALVIAIIDRMKTVLGVRMDKEVSEKLDSSRSQVSVWKTRGVIPFAECMQLAVRYNVSLDWLILGRGQPHITEPVFDEHHGSNLSELLYWDKPGAMTEHNVDGQSWFIPVEWLEREGLKAGDLIAVRCDSDVMAPTFSNGQTVLVNMQSDKAADGVYLVQFGGRSHFRRIQHLSDGSLRVSCDNPAYAPEVVPAADRDQIKIQGYCYALVAPVL